MKYGLIAARHIDFQALHTHLFSPFNSLGWIVDGIEAATAMLRGILAYELKTEPSCSENLNVHWNTRLTTDLVPGCEHVGRMFKRSVVSLWGSVDSGLLVSLVSDPEWVMIGAVTIPRRVADGRASGIVLTELVPPKDLRRFIADPDFPLIEKLELASLG